MKIVNSVKVNHSIQDIWQILRDPSNMPAWNYKCQVCDADENIVVGSKFSAIFTLCQKSNSVTCEVIDLLPNNRITIRFSGKGFSSKGGYVDETFLLITTATNKTKIRHEVNFSKSRLPILIKFLLWFTSTFGYKVGRSSLDGIQDLLD